jgi:hypothetical protein
MFTSIGQGELTFIRVPRRHERVSGMQDGKCTQLSADNALAIDSGSKASLNVRI